MQCMKLVFWVNRVVNGTCCSATYFVCISAWSAWCYWERPSLYHHVLTMDIVILNKVSKLFFFWMTWCLTSVLDGISHFSCIPCPDHGVCSNGQLGCPPLYHVTRPWYNAYGLLPIADECVRDSAIGRAIDSAEKHIKRILARAQGQEVCEQLRMGGHIDDSAVARMNGSAIFDALLQIHSANDQVCCMSDKNQNTSIHTLPLGDRDGYIPSCSFQRSSAGS